MPLASVPVHDIIPIRTHDGDDLADVASLKVAGRAGFNGASIAPTNIGLNNIFSSNDATLNIGFLNALAVTRDAGFIAAYGLSFSAKFAPGLGGVGSRVASLVLGGLSEIGMTLDPDEDETYFLNDGFGYYSLPKFEGPGHSGGSGTGNAWSFGILAGFGAFDPTTSGTFQIDNLYAFYDDGMTKGGANWSYFNAGGADSYMGTDGATLRFGTTDTDLQISSDGTNGIIDVATSLRLGNITTNYAEVSSTGDVSFNGTARINWTKITANGVTLGDGPPTSGDAVADLQTANDGNTYAVAEIAGNAGQNLIVDFTGVTAFNWVQILARTSETVGHAVTIQLEITPFDDSAWHTFHVMKDQSADDNFESYSFFVPDDSAYINSGVVKVRFIHESNGSANDDWFFDVVALYQ